MKRIPPAKPSAGPGSLLRVHGTFLATALVCIVVFGWMVTFGTFRFGAEDVFGSFYDHQAAAWLQGRWDVPEPALSGEAFIVDGKVYGYFGPTPALMRLPFVLLGVGFAKVTRLLMIFDYAACLAGAYALLWLAVRCRHALAVPSRWAVVVFTTTVGLGSTVFFLGSRAYVYHEAILCGLAYALFATYSALRYWQAPTSRWWLIALIVGILAVHARAPIGLFALCVLGSAAALCLSKSLLAGDGKRGGLARIVRTAGEWPGLPPNLGPAGSYKTHLAIGIASVAGILSFNVVSYLKFGTFEGCPLRYNVQYTPEKLAVLEYRNFHPGNLRFNTDAYLLRPSFSLSARFPYVYREYLDRKKYPASRMAYRDQTLAMPWSMPALFAFATAGCALAAFTIPVFRPPIVLLGIAAIPAALAMLTAVAVTQRYTADFCPFLIAAAAFGVATFESSMVPMRRSIAMIASLLSAVGVLITFALTLHNQREIVWGVPEGTRRDYQLFRARVDAFFYDARAP